MSKNKKIELSMLDVNDCKLLERNPQYLTPKQMEALKNSIERDGFVSPILVRKINRKNEYEIVSGNHRYMAACELSIKNIPAVVTTLSKRESKRLAINLNLIHGDPTAEQLAPFLVDMDDELLGQIYFEKELLKEILNFDDILGERLQSMSDVPNFDQQSSKNRPNCVCPKCGRLHQSVLK